ncbi:Predicted arabinose efflux permease, MFS family [Paramicrobacterium humi]|uniref:Predicted arabinose efflux permease, MFS family n=1 Tax=Paramicrobacterium humi TaxID=640635 RepID=A0A1H4IUY1_9MICO|nr:MFS transporter [Microbacterium humi]SEB37807.1 Predicted arabinose efflux permease, MFS family [Microbacterium humi]
MTSATFRSLAGYNYRLWAAGALVSNVGTWMQRTAQDWLVLTELTDNNAVAVGIVMALQFGPPVLLLPVTGWVADRFDRRHVLMATQSAMGVLGLLLGLLTVTGVVQLWHVYVFAFLLGCTAAFDAPARQVFVSSLVERHNLSNAVGLNSASFNIARMIGPAVAGLLIAVIGTGWVFLINAASFAAVLASLALLRKHELYSTERASGGKAGLIEGFRYIRHRPDIMVILVIIFIIGTFGLNFPIFTSTMATTVFHKGAGEFGVLSSIMAIGSVAGALLAARRERPRISLLFAGGAVFGVGCTFAAVAPGYWLFAASLTIIGISAQTLTTSANSVVQLSTDPTVRGRVMAIYMAIFMGGTPIGAPIVGWVADTFGARWGLAVGAGSGFAAAIVGVLYLVKFHNMRVRFANRRLRLQFGDVEQAQEELATQEISIQRTSGS